MQSLADYLQAQNNVPAQGQLQGQSPLQSAITSQPNPDYGYGPRWDEAAQSYSGAPKGLGYFGPLQTKDGVMGELSRDGAINGKSMQYPLLVPTLSKDEVSTLLNGGPVSQSVEAKATAHAKERLAQGKSVWAQPGEQSNLYPELPRAPVPQMRNPPIVP